MSMPAGLCFTSRRALPAMKCGSEPSNWTRIGVPAGVRLPFFSSGQVRRKVRLGRTLSVTRTNSQMPQS